MTPLQQAAQAVIARWESPKWKDEAPTAVVIGALEKALADEQAPAVEAQTAREYADSMCKYREAQIKRLTTYLHNATEAA